MKLFIFLGAIILNYLRAPIQALAGYGKIV